MSSNKREYYGSVFVFVGMLLVNGWFCYQTYLWGFSIMEVVVFGLFEFIISMLIGNLILNRNLSTTPRLLTMILMELWMILELLVCLLLVDVIKAWFVL